jgi:hypothetical protein
MSFINHGQEKDRLKKKEEWEIKKGNKRPVITGFVRIQLEAEKGESIIVPAYIACSPHWSVHQSFLPLIQVSKTQNGHSY